MTPNSTPNYSQEYFSQDKKPKMPKSKRLNTSGRVSSQQIGGKKESATGK